MAFLILLNNPLMRGYIRLSELSASFGPQYSLALFSSSHAGLGGFVLMTSDPFRSGCKLASNSGAGDRHHAKDRD
jgi:hypothetical protein